MVTNPRILVVEPNLPLGRELAELLRLALDADVDHRETMDPGPEPAVYDAIVFDWNGAERKLGAIARPHGPALVALGVTEAQIRNAQTGELGQPIEAIERPFRFAELSGRLRDQLRRRWEAIGPRLGRFRFDPKAKLLVPPPPGEPVRLTEKESEILDFLYRKSGAVVEREVLLRALWRFESGATTHTLETHIYRLRQKLETDPSEARVLVTEEGGYRLVTSSPEPEEIDAHPAPLA